MDKKDEKILNMLLKNSRIPVTHIAPEIGMTETAVRKRIEKLEKIGAIRAYTAIVDPYFVGYEGAALVGVDAAPEKILTIFEELKGLPNVRYAALTTGDHMMMFEVWCKKTSELGKLIKDIEKMKGVTKVCPAIFLKRVE